MKRTLTLILAISMSFMMNPFLEGSEGTKQEQKVLNLSEITSNVKALKKTSLVFRGQFYKLSGVYRPFFTIFDSSSYLNFSAWDFDAPLWTEESFKSSFPLLYVKKGDTELKKQAMSLSKFARFEATGEIRSTFDNKPWILVTSIREIPNSLTGKTIRHLARGYRYLKAEDHLNAVLEFNRAFSETLPEKVKALIHKEEGASLFALELYSDACCALEKAADLQGDAKNPEIDSLMKKAKALSEQHVSEEEYDIEKGTSSIVKPIDWAREENTEPNEEGI